MLEYSPCAWVGVHWWNTPKLKEDTAGELMPDKDYVWNRCSTEQKIPRSQNCTIPESKSKLHLLDVFGTE